jgi:hypothetical protein
MNKTMWIVTIEKNGKTINFAGFQYLRDAKNFSSLFSLLNGKVSGRVSIGEINRLIKNKLAVKQNNEIRFINN